MLVPGAQRGESERLFLRKIALIWGGIGAGLALILAIDILYTSNHVLGQVAGLPSDMPHVISGLIVMVVGLIGALLAPNHPTLAGLMLGTAGFGFFASAGWWAFIAS